MDLLKKQTKRSYQAAKLDRFVEELIVDYFLFVVDRLPGQLYARVCHFTHFKLAWLARDCREQDKTHSNKTLAYSSANTWLCTIHKDYLLYV